jgi:hypothetical protein
MVTIGDRDSAGPIRESRSLGSGGEETIRILIVIVPLPSRRRLQRTGGTWTDTWFMSTDWNPNGVSDHAAILLDTWYIHQIPHKIFKFELCWFLIEDLADVVTKVWL